MTRDLRQRVDVLGWILVAAVFGLDLILPEGTAVALLYVVVLLLGLWTSGSRDVLYLAAFATVLSVIEYAVSPPGDHWAEVLSNHVLQIAVLWITAFGVNLHRRTLIAREQAERHAHAADARLREQAALAQIGKMAAVVAHEVRNPLAGIRGAVQIISSRLGSDAPEQRVAAEVVTRIDTLNAIVTDLLQFARPRQPRPVYTAIHPIVHTTVAFLRDDPALANVIVDVEGKDVTMLVDAELLKLVLHNLMVNSAQAMEGRGRIVVTATAGERSCEIRVLDNGPGIPPEVREHLFEPFFTTKHRGTGLGLATARRLIEAHGGTIELACPVAGGTAAIVRLPQTWARET